MFQRRRFVAEMTVDASFVRAAREDLGTIIDSSTPVSLRYGERPMAVFVEITRNGCKCLERVPTGQSGEQSTPAPSPAPSKSESLSRNCSYNCTKVNACYCCCQPARTAVLSSDRQTNAFIRMSYGECTLRFS